MVRSLDSRFREWTERRIRERKIRELVCMMYIFSRMECLKK